MDDIIYRYTDDKGRGYVSTTEILKAEGIIKGFYRNEELRKMGDDLHLLTRAVCEGRRIRSMPEEYTPRLDQWRRFLKDTGFTAELVEHRMLSPLLNYAGTADRFGKMRGVRWCLDLKFSNTSAQVWHEYQTVSYTVLASLDDKAKDYADAKRGSVIIRPDRYIFVPHTRIMDAKRKWLAINTAYHAKREAGVFYAKDFEEEHQW